MNQTEKNYGALKTLGVALYILAVIVLALAIWLWVSLAGAAATIDSILTPFLGGMQALRGLIGGQLRGLLSSLGFVFFLLGLLISLLLFASGRLLRLNADLAIRVQRLEKSLEKAV